jgi:hypothetical protein
MNFRSEKHLDDGSREYYIREINNKPTNITPTTNKNTPNVKGPSTNQNTPIEKITELQLTVLDNFKFVENANLEIYEGIQTATLNESQIDQLWNGPFAKSQEAYKSVSDAVDEVKKQLQTAEIQAGAYGLEELKKASADVAEEAVEAAVKAVTKSEEATRTASKALRAAKKMIQEIKK